MRPQCFVIGGGVVGLAVARSLSRAAEVILLESRAAIGSQTSSRNSEVIHSGIYYTPGSVKAQLTAPGSAALYEYVKARHVGHNRCGKIIVATTEAEAPKLSALKEIGLKNGVEDIQVLSGSDLRHMEPSLRGHSGLLVRSTGIINSHELMLALQADLEANGGIVVTNCSVVGARVSERVGPRGNKILSINTSQGEFESDVLVNCAGHSAPSIAARIEGHPISRVPRPYYCKGSYFKLTGVAAPFSRLVYPIPAEHGLGVHATIDMTGAMKFGPDTEWVEPMCRVDGAALVKNEDLPDWVLKTYCEKDYLVESDRSKSFYAEIRKYWPDLPDDSLVPDYSGFRPKIIGPTSAAAMANSVLGRDLKDFVIEGPSHHGVEGLVNLYGIESPGLTACLAIAAYVHKIIEARH